MLTSYHLTLLKFAPLQTMQLWKTQRLMAVTGAPNESVFNDREKKKKFLTVAATKTIFITTPLHFFEPSVF